LRRGTLEGRSGQGLLEEKERGLEGERGNPRRGLPSADELNPEALLVLNKSLLKHGKNAIIIPPKNRRRHVLFLKLILAHLIADFILQFEELYQLKIRSFLGHLFHALIHGLVSLALLYPYLNVLQIWIFATGSSLSI